MFLMFGITKELNTTINDKAINNSNKLNPSLFFTFTVTPPNIFDTLTIIQQYAYYVNTCLLSFVAVMVGRAIT
jgi:hypothetical protein